MGIHCDLIVDTITRNRVCIATTDTQTITIKVDRYDDRTDYEILKEIKENLNKVLDVIFGGD